MRKDINKYWNKYKEIYSFEEVLKIYREEKVLDFINKKNPKHILEIGCGFTPLFLKYKNFESYTVVEPAEEAFENAIKLSKKNKKINFLKNYFENCHKEFATRTFDCIICPGVLHETSTPKIFLDGINNLMRKDTYVYINVPNALSLHRIIAKEMGIIKNLNEKTERNISLQQNTIFDKDSLQDLILEVIPNAKIEECFTFFIKPFTHEQMMSCCTNKIINKDVIEGLAKTTNILSEYGCELSCIFKKLF